MGDAIVTGHEAGWCGPRRNNLYGSTNPPNPYDLKDGTQPGDEAHDRRAAAPRARRYLLHYRPTLGIARWTRRRRGWLNAFAVPIVIGLFWMATGIAAYAYQHNPSWLLFLAEGTVLLGASLGLRGARPADAAACYPPLAG